MRSATPRPASCAPGQPDDGVQPGDGGARGYYARLLALPRAALFDRMATDHPLPLPAAWSYSPDAFTLATDCVELHAGLARPEPDLFEAVSPERLLNWSALVTGLRLVTVWAMMLGVRRASERRAPDRAQRLSALAAEWRRVGAGATLAEHLLTGQAALWVSPHNTEAERLHLLTMGAADVRQRVLLSLGGARQR